MEKDMTVRHQCQTLGRRGAVYHATRHVRSVSRFPLTGRGGEERDCRFIRRQWPSNKRAADGDGRRWREGGRGGEWMVMVDGQKRWERCVPERFLKRDANSRY